MKPPADTPPRMAPLLLGIVRVARGRKDGLAKFGGTSQSVLSALAPLVAFMLVGAVIGLLSGSRNAVGDVAAVSISLLGPLVISFEIAWRWDRARHWFQFATAYCWCQWAAPAVLLAVMLLTGLLIAGGVDGNAAASLGLVLLFGYGLWLHWFLARHALELSGLRAALLVAGSSVATMLLILLPQLADYALNGSPPS